MPSPAEQLESVVKSQTAVTRTSPIPRPLLRRQFSLSKQSRLARIRFPPPREDVRATATTSHGSGVSRVEKSSTNTEQSPTPPFTRNRLQSTKRCRKRNIQKDAFIPISALPPHTLVSQIPSAAREDQVQSFTESKFCSPTTRTQNFVAIPTRNPGQRKTFSHKEGLLRNRFFNLIEETQALTREIPEKSRVNSKYVSKLELFSHITVPHFPCFPLQYPCTLNAGPKSRSRVTSLRTPPPSPALHRRPDACCLSLTLSSEDH